MTRLDSARKEGRQEGELVGKIQILQQLLGEEPSSTARLRERTISELSTLLADLQQRLRSKSFAELADLLLYPNLSRWTLELLR